MSRDHEPRTSPPSWLDSVFIGFDKPKWENFLGRKVDGNLYIVSDYHVSVTLVNVDDIEGLPGNLPETITGYHGT